ncbi:MAG: hypothetical protein N3G20_05455 [Verrucomicrobiae bacterium]|nr:hypothetical protein [Verrucomicrobiae bacterium]
MNPEQFEETLRQQPFRAAPRSWRGEILAEAQRTAEGSRPRPSMFDEIAAALRLSPVVWTALGAAWIAIIVLERLAAPNPDELANAWLGARIAERNLQVVTRISDFLTTLGTDSGEDDGAPEGAPDSLLPKHSLYMGTGPLASHQT